MATIGRNAASRSGGARPPCRQWSASVHRAKRAESRPKQRRHDAGDSRDCRLARGRERTLVLPETASEALGESSYAGPTTPSGCCVRSRSARQRAADIRLRELGRHAQRGRRDGAHAREARSSDTRERVRTRACSCSAASLRDKYASSRATEDGLAVVRRQSSAQSARRDDDDDDDVDTTDKDDDKDNDITVKVVGDLEASLGVGGLALVTVVMRVSRSRFRAARLRLRPERMPPVLSVARRFVVTAS